MGDQQDKADESNSDTSTRGLIDMAKEINSTIQDVWSMTRSPIPGATMNGEPIRVGAEIPDDNGGTRIVVGDAHFEPGDEPGTVKVTMTETTETEPPQPAAATPEAMLLREAIQTINGARQDTYGNAEVSFQVIADFWRTYLRGKFGCDLEISAVDTALMLDLMKTARLTQTDDHRDSLVDKAGYTALAWRAVDQRSAPDRDSLPRHRGDVPE